MTITAEMILLLIALVLFLLSAGGLTTRFNLQSLGLALVVLALLFNSRR